MNTPLPIESEIRKLGLNTNESKVYLAILEAGHSSVQDIAQRVKLSRPTTYRIIEALNKKGVVLREGKRVSAQSPDELLGILRANKRRIEEQEREFMRIIGLLKAKYAEPHKNEIKLYAGKPGIKFILDDFSATHARYIFVIFHSKEDAIRPELEKIYASIQKRLGKVTINEMYPEKVGSSKLPFVERKYIPHLESYFPGTLILTDKIIYSQKEETFVIEQESIVYLIHSIVNSLWQAN